jgi:putative ABC transport system permease protein
VLRLDDNLTQSISSLQAHKLRTVLTIIGLTMGVATLITVMTIVQGANLYVEQKIANLGTNVFQLARTPFAATDFDLVIKALKYKHIELDDLKALQQLCDKCGAVGASASSTDTVKYAGHELSDVNVEGQTSNMSEIDTRTLLEGRYFTESEDSRGANVCLLGATPVDRLFGGADPLGKNIRVASDEFTVVGTFEKLGSVLGQDADNFVVVPLNAFFRIKGSRFSLTINVKTPPGERAFTSAMDQARMIMRARRHVAPGKEENFFFGTKDSYMALWQSISGAFFVVFILVSSISAVVGGIVIMNIMLVSVTERTKEIGIRRAMGATQSDIRRQFLAESVSQCIVGGFVGIIVGFGIALLLRNFTSFPAAVQTWVAIMGLVLSSAIGLFFGIYPAVRASRLDPVVALRAE